MWSLRSDADMRRRYVLIMLRAASYRHLHRGVLRNRVSLALDPPPSRPTSRIISSRRLAPPRPHQLSRNGQPCSTPSSRAFSSNSSQPSANPAPPAIIAARLNSSSRTDARRGHVHGVPPGRPHRLVHQLGRSPPPRGHASPGVRRVTSTSMSAQGYRAHNIAASLPLRPAVAVRLSLPVLWSS